MPFFFYFSFNNWAFLEPDGSGACLAYDVSKQFKWGDFPCDNYTASGLSAGFICEIMEQKTTVTLPTTTQMVTTPTPGKEETLYTTHVHRV